jgi:hypothetical protein
MELLLPLRDGFIAIAMLLVIMWLAVKWPAHGLRKLDLLAALKQE